MRDLETETLWSHLLGRGMEGALSGTRLEMLPATMTTWGDWKKRFPETTILAMSRTVKRYDARAWENPRRFVYGVSIGAGIPSPAVSLQKLQKSSLVMIDWEENSIVVTHHEKGGSVQAFSTMYEGAHLVFKVSERGTMVDGNTNSAWDILTGKAISGQLKGASLQRLPGTISFRKAWEAFHPDGRVER